MNGKGLLLIVGTACTVIAGAIGYMGAAMQADAKADTKINQVVDRAVAPMNRQLDQLTGDVREIRNLLGQILLSRSGGM